MCLVLGLLFNVKVAKINYSAMNKNVLTLFFSDKMEKTSLKRPYNMTKILSWLKSFFYF